MMPKYTLPPLLVSEYSRRLEMAYHSLARYTPGFPQLVPGFARCTLAHHQTEGDWCRSLNVSELLHHKSQCILPSLTNLSIRQEPLRGNSEKKKTNCVLLIDSKL